MMVLQTTKVSFMNRIFIILFVFAFPFIARGQQYISHNGVIIFYSHAMIEDITAVNNKVSSGLNVNTLDLAFSVPIKSFAFAKALMREHFNEKYMESEKYPNATFAGKIEGFDPKTPGQQNVKAKGNLTIHGVTQLVEILGTLDNSKNEIKLKSKFIVRLADYNVSIPTMLWKNIAEQVEVRVDVTYSIN